MKAQKSGTSYRTWPNWKRWQAVSRQHRCGWTLQSFSGDRQALVKLIEAARILNDVFMRQMWGGNIALYGRLQRDTTPLGKARLHYFWLNKGPWSDIDDYKAFLPGVPPRSRWGRISILRA